MRLLTIRRNKSFVGCLMSAKIYLEDPMYGDTTINNVKCRKLGEIKNGCEGVYEISEASAKVFVIADKLSKGFCNEFYQLPEGTEPVLLTGQNRFNLASGNAFRFDNNFNPEAEANRKKGKKRGIWVLIAAAIIGFIIGFVSNIDSFKSNTPKTFTKKGMSITLTDGFREENYEGFDVCYESKKAVIFAIKESFDMFEGAEGYSVEDYADLVMEANGEQYEMQSDNGLYFFEYDWTNEKNTDYHYWAFLYKGPDAFWMIQMSTFKEDALKEEPHVMEWAQSVSFTD